MLRHVSFVHYVVQFRFEFAYFSLTKIPISGSILADKRGRKDATPARQEGERGGLKMRRVGFVLIAMFFAVAITAGASNAGTEHQRVVNSSWSQGWACDDGTPSAECVSAFAEIRETHETWRSPSFRSNDTNTTARACEWHYWCDMFSCTELWAACHDLDPTAIVAPGPEGFQAIFPGGSYFFTPYLPLEIRNQRISMADEGRGNDTSRFSSNRRGWYTFGTSTLKEWGLIFTGYATTGADQEKLNEFWPY